MTDTPSVPHPPTRTSDAAAPTTPAGLVEWLPVGSLHVDPRVQRGRDEARIADMARNYDDEALGVLTVSRREDGTLSLVDGQHRAAATAQARGPATRVLCEVHTGLTVAEEAARFIKLNDTRKPRRIVIFERMVVAGDPAACAIAHICEEYGLTVAAGGQPGTIGAVQSLERIYHGTSPRERKHGPYPDALRRTLRTAVHAWGHTAEAVDGYLLQGIGLVWLRYGDEVDGRALARKLGKEPAGANGVLAKAKGLRELKGGSLPRCVAEVVVAIYNRQRRKGRLAEWG